MPPPALARACEIITAVSPKPEESVFLSACRRQPVPYTPVWFMRQAGRSLPEYRQARGKTAMGGVYTKPELITELTLQSIRRGTVAMVVPDAKPALITAHTLHQRSRYAVDRAILFSDIVVPLREAGVKIDS